MSPILRCHRQAYRTKAERPPVLKIARSNFPGRTVASADLSIPLLTGHSPDELSSKALVDPVGIDLRIAPFAVHPKLFRGVADLPKGGQAKDIRLYPERPQVGKSLPVRQRLLSWTD